MILGRRYISDTEKMVLWSDLSDARNEAINEVSNKDDPWQLPTGKLVDPYPVPFLDTPWLSYLRKKPSFKTANIDVIQHVYAHKWLAENKYILDERRMNQNLYDLFIRPLERLFGNDMKMARSLLHALEDKALAKQLKIQILSIAQLDYPDFLTSDYMLEQISKIRCHRGSTLWRTPPKTLPPITRVDPLHFPYTHRNSDYKHWTPMYDPPTPKDFYPKGRLFGRYVDVSTEIPKEVWSQFFTYPPAEIDDANLRCEIVLAKAEWTRQVHNQVVLQSGQQHGHHSIKQFLPTWTYSAVNQPMSNLQEIKNMIHKNAVEESNPDHSQQKDDRTKSTGNLSDVSMRTADSTEPMDIDKKTSYPKPLEPGFLPPEWEITDKMTPMERIKIGALKKIRFHRHTFFPDEDEARNHTNHVKKLDWKYTSPQEKEKELDRLLKANGVADLNYHIPDWTVRPKTGDDKSPSADSNEDFPLWNGCQTDIPEWASSPISAKQLRKTHPMMIPKQLLHRVKIGPTYRMIPMDGVNRIQDNIIRHITIQNDNFMLIQTLTKKRQTWQTEYDKRSILIPYTVMPNIIKTLKTMAHTVLPRADQDYNLENPILFKNFISVEKSNYFIEVIITSDRHGDERLVRLYEENEKANITGSLVYPWLYTTSFMAHLQHVYYGRQK